MKRLMGYLDKNGIRYNTGRLGNDYFFGAPAPHDIGITIVFAWDGTAGERARNAKMQRKLERYLTRYGYTVYRACGYPGETRLMIARADYLQQIDFYYDFVRKSREACEKYIHVWRSMGTSLTAEEQNDFLRGVMDFWEGEYKAAKNDAEVAGVA